MISRLSCAALFATITTLPLAAGEPDFVTPVATTPPPSGDRWEFSIAPYMWFAGLDGTVGIGGNTADVDMDFGDIWDKLELGGMLVVEARKGRWGVVADGLYLRLSGDGRTPTTAYGKAKVTVEEARVAPMLTYRVVEDSNASVDLMAGFQWMYVDSELKLNAGTLPAAKFSDSESWIDPMIGVRAKYRFNGPWWVMGRGDIGGFGVESDLTWMLQGVLGYDINESFSLMAGYRHLYVDYSNKGFVYDTSTSGFIVGLAWTF